MLSCQGSAIDHIIIFPFRISCQIIGYLADKREHLDILEQNFDFSGVLERDNLLYQNITKKIGLVYRNCS